MARIVPFANNNNNNVNGKKAKSKFAGQYPNEPPRRQLGQKNITP